MSNNVELCSSQYVESIFGVWPERTGSNVEEYSAIRVTPFHDEGLSEIPLGDFLNDPKEYRCKRCQAYVNPYIKLSGNKWTCNFCRAVNAIPVAWNRGIFDSNGNHRFAQLYSATYEIPADQIQFYGHQNCTPVFIFCICTSQGAYMVPDVIESIIELLNQTSTSIKIAIMTYDINPVLYSFRNGTWSSHIVNGPEFAPVPPSVAFLDSKEHLDDISSFLRTLPKLNSSAPQSCCFVRALNTCGRLFQEADNRCGKVICFNYDMPNSLRNFKLKERKKSTEFAPSLKTFSNISSQFHLLGLSIDLFNFSDDFNNLKTILTLHESCGGNFFDYDANFQQADLSEELQNALRGCKWNIQYALRFSECYRVIRHFRAFGLSVEKFCNRSACMQTQDSITFAVKRRNDTNLKEVYIYAQFACAYCDDHGKFLRIHTLQIPTSSRPPMVIENLNLNVLNTYLVRIAIQLLRKNGLEDAQRTFQDSLLEILTEYATVTRTAGIMEENLPPRLALWPDMVLGALKGAFSNTPLPDRQMKWLFQIWAASPSKLEKCFAPALYIISDMVEDPNIGFDDGEGFVFPATAPLTANSLTKDVALLLDAGSMFILWVGQDVSEDFMTACFGADFNEENMNLLERGSDEESILNRVWNVIEESGYFTYDGVRKPSMEISTNPAVLTPYLYDDATNSIMSRAEFYNFIYQQTRPKISRV